MRKSAFVLYKSNLQHKLISIVDFCCLDDIILNVKPLASHCSCADQFVSDLGEHQEDMFS